MALLEALARFASTTGAAVCGEGIETVAELRMLARADATYAQGFALGRPGPAWPLVDEAIAQHTTSEVSMGMRLARHDPGLPLSLGEVAETLGQVRTRADLSEATKLIERLLHADKAIVSRVVPGERCIETLTDHEGVELEERYSYDDFPTTEHVIVEQILGQIVVDDPASDPAERDLLAGLGLAAVLMVPIISRGETVGLLEVSRRTARPWTSSQIDNARLLAQSLAAAIRVEARADVPLPWSPDAIGTRTHDRH
jgi:transcriptional regulator with GAF, ATPase, and Fis domain